MRVVVAILLTYCLAFAQMWPFPGPGRAGAAAPPPAGLAYVGGASVTCSSGTSCAVTYSPTAGNLVIVDEVIGLNPAAETTAPTDNATGGSTTYSQTYADANALGLAAISEFYSCNVKAGATTITAHPSASAMTLLIVTEYSGGATADCLDVVGSRGRGDGGTAQAAPSITPTASQNAVIHGIFVDLENKQTSYGTSGSYVGRQSVMDPAVWGWTLGVTSQVVASTSGTYAAAATAAVSMSVSENRTVSYK